MMTMISSAFASLVSEITKVPESDLRGDMDVVYDLGLSGDDFDEFIFASSLAFRYPPNWPTTKELFEYGVGRVMKPVSLDERSCRQ